MAALTYRLHGFEVFSDGPKRPILYFILKRSVSVTPAAQLTGGESVSGAGRCEPLPCMCATLSKVSEGCTATCTS